jgi:hypothetical protein
MSTKEEGLEQEQERLGDLMSDLGHGLGLMAVLAGRNPAIVSLEETLELFAAFEAAYGPLADLQAVGRFDMGRGILSPELRERITRLGALLRLPPESTEAKDAAAEIHVLAEECLRMLVPEMASPSEPSKPT